MRSFRGNLFLLVLILLAVLGLVAFNDPAHVAPEEVSFSTLMHKVDQGDVKDVTISGQALTGHFRNGTEFTTVGPADVSTFYDDFVEHGVVPNFEQHADQSQWMNWLVMLLPIGLTGVLLWWLMRNIQGSNGRAMSFGKSRARMHGENMRRVTFEDVAGIDESKAELEEIIDFLKDPRKVTSLGGRIPKGVLLMGPPGTGKTLLARAVAGEAGVPFFSISGSDFVEMFVGVGASRVRDLFEQARKNHPCIIFIDEIDAVGRSRGIGMGGGHDEREQTLNQLLVEMDGFEGTEGVILMAATNRPDVLDPALLRPGRFDRRVTVPNPDVRGREKILQIHTKKMPLAPDVDLEKLAKLSPGFSGADLENLCNEAALLAARKGRKRVVMEDFSEARDKVYMGPERKSMVMPESEKRATAYHEAGHAIVRHLLPGHGVVHKVTIVPRGRALGITWYMDEQESHSRSREDYLVSMTSLMGGRAAEEVALSSLTDGAGNDLERATKLARTMIMDLGMSDLGPVVWGERQEPGFLGPGGRVQNYSEETARRIDTEVRSLLTKTYAAAVQIVRDNLHVVHKIAQALVDRETIEREEFLQIVSEAAPVNAHGLEWLRATPPAESIA